MNFESKIRTTLTSALDHYYGVENHDSGRFGEFVDDRSWRPEKGIVNSIKKNIKNLIYPLVPKYKKQYGEEKRRKEIEVNHILQELEPFLDNLELIYNDLEPQDKNLYVSVITMRLIGPRKIKLSVNNSVYWENISKVKEIEDSSDRLNPEFRHFMLNKYNLKDLGIPVVLYYMSEGVSTTFLNEQYAYKKNGGYMLHAEKNDVVLDLGGCWGDTALYFANKIGDGGRVFTFEMIPGNIKILKKNISLNPDLINRITLVERPVTETDDEKLYFKDDGPASHVSTSPFPGYDGEVLSTSIDGYFRLNKTDRVDFIKMDIEGAEMKALLGGIETIKKYKPKLAISVYHSWEDFSLIPKWIIDLDLGYKIYFGHHTIHSEESVIYAIAK